MEKTAQTIKYVTGITGETPEEFLGKVNLAITGLTNKGLWKGKNAEVLSAMARTEIFADWLGRIVAYFNISTHGNSDKTFNYVQKREIAKEEKYIYVEANEVKALAKLSRMLKHSEFDGKLVEMVNEELKLYRRVLEFAISLLDGEGKDAEVNELKKALEKTKIKKVRWEDRIYNLSLLLYATPIKELVGKEHADKITEAFNKDGEYMSVMLFIKRAITGAKFISKLVMPEMLHASLDHRKKVSIKDLKATSHTSRITQEERIAALTMSDGDAVGEMDSLAMDSIINLLTNGFAIPIVDKAERMETIKKAIILSCRRKGR